MGSELVESYRVPGSALPARYGEEPRRIPTAEEWAAFFPSCSSALQAPTLRWPVGEWHKNVQSASTDSEQETIPLSLDSMQNDGSGVDAGHECGRGFTINGAVTAASSSTREHRTTLVHSLITLRSFYVKKKLVFDSGDGLLGVDAW